MFPRQRALSFYFSQPCHLETYRDVLDQSCVAIGISKDIPLDLKSAFIKRNLLDYASYYYTSDLVQL